jgi:hypothetical protein
MSVITTHSISSTRSRPLINNPIFPWSKIKLSEHYRNLFPRYGHSTCTNSVKNELYFFGGISCEKVNNHVFLLDTGNFTSFFLKKKKPQKIPFINYIYVFYIYIFLLFLYIPFIFFYNYR